MRRRESERSRYYTPTRSTDKNENFPDTPCNDQWAFIHSEALERWGFGGNRSGKTETAEQDCNMFCIGTHPIRSEHRRPPVRVRFCAPKWRDGIEGVILPKFQQIIQRRHLKGGSWAKAWSEKNHKLTFANGSTIQFKSGEEDIDTYGGVDLDAVYVDEHLREPYYVENKARLADRRGFMVNSMTPELGVTWEQDHVETDQFDLDGKPIDIAHWFFSIKGNPHLNRQGVLDFIAAIKDPKRRETKTEGVFHPLSGVVLPQYDPDIHVVPDIEIPASWPKIFCIDTHHRTPSAAMWAAWDPDGAIWVYRTLKGRYTVKEWQEIIRARSINEYIVAMLMDAPGHTTGVDINLQESLEHQFQNGDLGLNIRRVTKNTDSSFDAGILKLWEMFSIDPMTKKTRIKILKSCDFPTFHLDGKPHGSLVWELARYRYKKEQAQDEERLREKVVLVNDHLIDCLRYIVMYGKPRPHGQIQSSLDGSW